MFAEIAKFVGCFRLMLTVFLGGTKIMLFLLKFDTSSAFQHYMYALIHTSSTSSGRRELNRSCTRLSFVFCTSCERISTENWNGTRENLHSADCIAKSMTAFIVGSRILNIAINVSYILDQGVGKSVQDLSLTSIPCRTGLRTIFQPPCSAQCFGCRHSWNIGSV